MSQEKIIQNAKHFWSAVCEGVDADLSFEEAKELEESGLIYGLRKLAGRGRYANRWEAYPSDLLVSAVREGYNKKQLMEEIASRQVGLAVGSITADGHLIGEE